MSPDFDDSLDDLLGGPLSPVARPAVTPPASYKPQHIEPCRKCGGTGRFVSYAGRTVGPCFTCKGKGSQSFAAPRAERDRASAQARARKVDKAAQAMADFIAEFPAESAWLIAQAPRWPVAADLLGAVGKFGGLTENQIAMVRRGILRDETRAAERAKRAEDAPAVDASKIEKAFATARERAARPGQMGVMVKPIKLQSGDHTVRFTPGSVGSKWDGMLFAKSGDGKKLGSIAGGRFTRRFECTDSEAAAVLDCASNPEKAAVAYGKAYSQCGICGRGLLNDELIARGIGPICAERFGW